MKTGQRNVSLDITRIIAVMAVVMIHTVGKFVDFYDTASTEFILGNVFDSISLLGVPLFVMVSGSLMLDENKNFSIKDLIFRRIRNIALLTVFWSVLYCCIFSVILPISRGEALSLPGIAYALTAGHYHMWYLYMVIGLYFVTPFLRAFVKKENKNLILLFILISVISQFTLPVLNILSLKFEETTYIIKLIGMLQLNFFGYFIAYYLMGWYIVHVGIKNKRLLYCLGIVSLLITIVYVQFTGNYANAYANENLFVMLYSVAVFTALNCGKERSVGGRTGKVLETLSGLSFGVYIVHPLTQMIVDKVIVYTKYPLLYIVLYYTSVIVLSFAGCYIVSKLPVIKKAVRG